MQQPTLPQQTYSTIFNCKQDFLVCSLRALQGLICCVMSYYFIRGYIRMNKRQLITNQDKQIYLLSLMQVALLAVYFLLFEEFFMLATIRNLLVWTDVVILSILCQIHFANNRNALERATWGIYLLRVGNFVMWFFVAVVDGTTITNTSFNVGYNCLIEDWLQLSGYLLFVSLLCAFVGLQIYDRLQWQGQNLNKDVKSTQQTILIFIFSTLLPSVMMFIWDFISHLHSQTQQDCVDMFMGNTFPRKILFFVLKIITMQVQPLGIYYTTYYKVCRDNPDDGPEIVANSNEMELIMDDTYSVLNTSVISRGSSRASLLSSHSKGEL